MKNRVAIYARYSSALQKPTSIADQFSMAERHAASREWSVVHRFSDSEISGTLGNRPGLNELRNAVRRGEIDIVIVEAIDRLTRNVVHALEVYNLMEFANIELYSLAEGSQNFMSVMLTAWGAREYSKSVSIHTKRGMAAALQNGSFHMRPYGYRKCEKSNGSNREIDPAISPIVQRIYRAFADGASANRIARDLNEDGIPAPRGGTWDGRTIRGNADRQEGILNNPIYIGRVLLFRTTHQIHPETENRVIVPTPDDCRQIEIPALRIISDSLWQKVRDRSAKTSLQVKKAKNPEAARRKKHLLSGLIVCGCCGKSFVKRSKTSFGCGENYKGACENTRYIRQDAIEARVFDALRAPLAVKHLAAAFDAALAREIQTLRKNPPEAEIPALKAALSQVDKKLRNLTRSLEEGAPYSQVKPRMQDLSAQQIALTDKIAALIASAEACPEIVDATSAYEDVLKRLEDLLGDPAWVHLANEHLSQLILRITLTPDPENPKHLNAEIIIDLGDLLCVAGQSYLLQERFRHNQQITVKLGALPPLAAPAPPEYFRLDESI